MKFTKTIAKALARKALQILYKQRDEAIKNFQVDEATLTKISTLADNYIQAYDAWENARKALNNAYGVNHYGQVSKESILRECISRERTKTIPPCPSACDLEDDFLIESMEVEDADELIAKVTAKYAI